MQARLAQVVALLALLVLPAGGAYAGGPLALRTDGTPYVWSTAVAVPYRTDNGPLSATVNESAAQTRVRAMFDCLAERGVGDHQLHARRVHQ